MFHAGGVSDSPGISGSIVDERQDTKAQRNYRELLLNKGQSGSRAARNFTSL